MKTVVLRSSCDEAIYHPRLLDFGRYYGFRPRVCGPYRPQTKGKVEKLVSDVKNNFFYGREFRDLTDLNDHVLLGCDKVNSKVHGKTKHIKIAQTM